MLKTHLEWCLRTVAERLCSCVENTYERGMEMINNISDAIPAAQAGDQEGLNYIYYNTY